MTHHGLPAPGGGKEEEERHLSTEKIPRDGMPADAPTDRPEPATETDGVVLRSNSLNS